MSVTEPKYLAFVAVIVALYYLLPGGRGRVGLLTLASYAFYFLLAPGFLPVLVGVMLVAFIGGKTIARFGDSEKARRALIVTVVLLLLPLLYYKYANFVLREIGAGLGIQGSWESSWIVGHVVFPIGISFYVFQAIGYVADIYLGVGRAEFGLAELALFMGFFPILTAGPIERAPRLVPQFHAPVIFESERLLAGMRLILFGLVLKLGIANSLAVPVDAVFGSVKKAAAVNQVLAAIFFSFQIYADVAGYSLIAVGTGKLLGIELTMNFRQPFLSDNIQEFWRNWHISLSTWLRDYLFMPMRAHWRAWRVWGPVVAVLITFVIAGIWHGAGWTYVIYGLTQGLFLAGSILTLKARNEFWRGIGIPLVVLTPIRVLITFLMVTISLVFVRSDSVRDAWIIVRHFFLPSRACQARRDGQASVRAGMLDLYRLGNWQRFARTV